VCVCVCVFAGSPHLDAEPMCVCVFAGSPHLDAEADLLWGGECLLLRCLCVSEGLEMLFVCEIRSSDVS